MAGAVFGDLGVSLFVTGAIFGDLGVSFFVAGAAFGDLGVSLFVARAVFGEIWSEARKVTSANGRVRDDEFMLGSFSDHGRIMLESSPHWN